MREDVRATRICFVFLRWGGGRFWRITGCVWSLKDTNKWRKHACDCSLVWREIKSVRNEREQQGLTEVCSLAEQPPPSTDWFDEAAERWTQRRRAKRERPHCILSCRVQVNDFGEGRVCKTVAAGWSERLLYPVHRVDSYMHLDEGGEAAVGGWTGAVFVQVCLRGGIHKSCPFDLVSVTHHFPSRRIKIDPKQKTRWAPVTPEAMKLRKKIFYESVVRRAVFNWHRFRPVRSKSSLLSEFAFPPLTGDKDTSKKYLLCFKKPFLGSSKPQNQGWGEGPSASCNNSWYTCGLNSFLASLVGGATTQWERGLDWQMKACVCTAGSFIVTCSIFKASLINLCCIVLLTASW